MTSGHDPDKIWNRAVDYDGAPILSMPGDQALRDVLTFHGTAMNGGALHAVQSYRDDVEFPLERVIEGFEFLDLVSAAEAIRHVVRARPDAFASTGAE